MVRFCLFLFSLFIGVASAQTAHGTSKKESMTPNAYIETVLSPETTVAGVSAIYSVVVWSNVPDILRVQLTEDPSFGPLKVSDLRLTRNSDNYVGEKKVKGEVRYGYVIDNLVVTSENAGKFTIAGGSYRICLGVESYVDDWFWGRQRSTEPFWVIVRAPDVKLVVKKRPASLSLDSALSTGDFSSSWSVPPGDISEGNRGIAIYKISGTGILDRLTVPDFETIFGEDLKVVYVKPSVRSYLKGTDLWSDMDIVVEFIPAVSGEIKLPDVKFEYLDPLSGKMKNCVPEKMTIEIKSDSRTPSKNAPVYEI